MKHSDHIPDLPDVPGLPDLPDLPGVPDLPQVRDLQELQRVPESVTVLSDWEDEDTDDAVDPDDSVGTDFADEAELGVEDVSSDEPAVEGWLIEEAEALFAVLCYPDLEEVPDSLDWISHAPTGDLERRYANSTRPIPMRQGMMVHYLADLWGGLTREEQVTLYESMRSLTDIEGLPSREQFEAAGIVICDKFE